MEYLINITDLHYKETKNILVEAKNKIEAVLKAACSIEKGETFADEVKNIQLGKKGKTHTVKTLKNYFIDYWGILVSTPKEIL